MLRRTVIAAGASAILTLSLAGCAGAQDNAPADETPVPEVEAPETPEAPEAPEASEPEPAPAQAPVLQSEPPMFIMDNTVYNYDGTTANVLDAIPGVEGDIRDYRYLQPMAENLVIVEYKTAEYDEEWKSYGEPTTHYAIVGEKAVSLDPILQKYSVDQIHQIRPFRNGMTFLDLASEENRAYIAIDSDGKELTPPLLWDNNYDMDVAGNYVEAYTQPRVAENDYSCDYEFYDKAGKLAYSGTNSVLVGENLVARTGDNEESIVYDTTGNPVVDLKSVANESAAKVYVVPIQRMANGVVEVDQYREAEDEYPSLYGLYSIPLEKWLVEPTTSQINVHPYGSDIFSVSVSDGTIPRQFFNATTGEVVFTDDENNRWFDLGNRWFVGIESDRESSYYGVYHFDGDNPGLYNDGSFPLVNNDDFDEGDLPDIY